MRIVLRSATVVPLGSRSSSILRFAQLFTTELRVRYEQSRGEGPKIRPTESHGRSESFFSVLRHLGRLEVCLFVRPKIKMEDGGLCIA